VSFKTGLNARDDLVYHTAIGSSVSRQHVLDPDHWTGDMPWI